MNSKQFEKHLQKDLPDGVLKSHQATLKKVLMKTYEQKRSNQLSMKNLSVKGGEYIMHHKALTFGMTGFAVLGLVIGIFVVGGSPFSPVKPAVVQAQEVIDRSFDRIIKLSPEEQKALEQKLEADLENSLQEARNAKDLEIVPESEIERIEMPKREEGKPIVGIKATFKAEGNAEPSLEKMDEKGERVFIKKGEEAGAQKIPDNVSAVGVAKPATRVHFDGGKIPAPHGVTVLRYTNSEGGKVFLGIDKEDKPVFKMIKMEKADGMKKETNVMFQQKID